MSVYVKLPDGEKKHFVQIPDSVHNMHMQIPGKYLFKDTLENLPNGTKITNHKALIGTWINLPLFPNSISTYISDLVYIHTTKTSGYDYIELITDPGSSFNQNKLQIDTICGLAVTNRSAQIIHGNSVSINCFCLSGNPYSGITIILDHISGRTGIKAQILSYNKFFKANTEYESSNTFLPELHACKNVNVVFTKLPGNILEVEVKVYNKSIPKQQFTVDANILKQSSIIFGMRNNNAFNNGARIYKTTIYNPDYIQNK